MISSTDAETIFSWKRSATEKEALRLIQLNAVVHAKDVGSNALKVFFSAERSFYVKGTVKVRKALAGFV